MSVEQELAEIEELESLARTRSPLASWAGQQAITKRAKLQLDPAAIRFAPDNVWSPHLTKGGSEGQGPALVADAYADADGQQAGTPKSGDAGFDQCPLCSGAGQVPKGNSSPSKLPTTAVESNADSNVAVDGKSGKSKVKKSKK